MFYHDANPIVPAFLGKLHRQVPVEASVLAAYVGRYQLYPGFVLTARADGNRLFVQATGQSEFEAFAESETDFFFRVVDAQITFDRLEGSVSPPLTLHQNGRDRSGKRLP